jgi:2-C-methyl-D-erythritol 4-phosphate cytidylyltransferase
VQQGLKEVDESDVVFIHDAVRPFISIPLLHRCYEQAICQGSAIPAINTVESMRYFNGVAYEIIDRAALKVIQTPQTFQAALVKKAFNQEYNTAFTDEASVVEYGGGAVHLIEGEKHNIKITTPEDILLAEAILNLEQEN